MGWKSIAAGLAGVALLGGLLFTVNGRNRAWMRPRIHLEGSAPGHRDASLRVLALNVAKCGLYEGRGNRGEMERRLDVLAEVLREVDADLVVLSEVVFEAGTVRIDQAEFLARECGYPHWVGMENYSFGLPFLRVRPGNALLSRFALRKAEGIQLAGGAPFWNPSGNRRALLVEALIRREWMTVGSIRNDSHDSDNNLRQTRQLLERVGSAPALLAGDFNAEHGSDSIELLIRSGDFGFLPASPATYPAEKPTRRIDHILAPAGWTLVEHGLVDTGISDHLGVVATYRVPGQGRRRR